MMWENFLALVIEGLACGFVDSYLGMGYRVVSAAGILLSYSRWQKCG